MGIRFLLLLFFYSLSGIMCKETQEANIIVRGSSITAETNDEFVCATIDWWPPEKCDYNQCPWGQASVFNLDLNHTFLANAIRAFSPLRIRVGGSLQDQVVYGVETLGYPCKQFSKIPGALFGFSKGCLNMKRWDELNHFFQKTGAIVTFGLNALRGRHHVINGIWEGAWNSSNARDFIKYTVSKGYPVDSWEFGNELSGRGIGASVNAEQYGKDVIVLRNILNELYKNSTSRPLLLAPGGFYDQKWYAQLLEVSGSGVVDGLTHHVYNLGSGKDPNIQNRITNPEYLNHIANTFRDLELTIQRHGPWSSAWVGEAGGAYNSGSRTVSNTFLNSFWYVDQLGMSSKYNTKAYCRQTLIGGNYGLLDTETFIPNPDYYSALLWHRLMGKGVLSIDLSGSSYLRAYAHCRKKEGGVSLALINLSKSTEFNVTVRNDLDIDLAKGRGVREDNSFVHGLKKTVSWVGKKVMDESENRYEYHLTTKDGNPLARTVLLNGNLLALTKDGDIPALNRVSIPVDSPVKVSPMSIAFIVFPNFEAVACA